MSYCVHWLTASDCLPRTKMLQAVELDFCYVRVSSEEYHTNRGFASFASDTPRSC